MANKEVVEITPSAIRKFLTRYNPESAISEYIWNGFDANAKHIYINFKEKEHSLGLYESVSIIDDGDGICYEELAYKFKKFNESQKKSSKTTNLIKGKNGYGRFTFFKFANYADWSTAYEKADKLCKYNISIKNHASWLEMHKQIVGFLISHFDLESKMTAKINRSGYTHFTITYSDIIHGLKEFAINNKLPYMSRKWNIISPQVRVRNKMKISQIREVKKMYKSGVKIYKLADMFGVSYSLIERVVNKEY